MPDVAITWLVFVTVGAAFLVVWLCSIEDRVRRNNLWAERRIQELNRKVTGLLDLAAQEGWRYLEEHTVASTFVRRDKA